MANRYYNNDTNIIIDFTVAQAADVENKANDIVAGFGSVQDEIDAEIANRVSDIAEAIKVNATGETPDITITQAAAQRASKLVGFDLLGDIELKTIGATEAAVNQVTRITGDETLTAFGYYLIAPGSYTASLPASPSDGDWVDIHLENGVASSAPALDGNGNTIESYNSIDLNVDIAEFRIAFNGTEWKV